MNIIYYWLTMGPYHYARMNALQEADSSVSVKVIEATNRDDHNWNTFPEKKFKHQVLLSGTMLSQHAVKEANKRLVEVLESEQADILVNGAGYYHASSIYPLLKLKNKPTKTVLWSESTEVDQKRVAWKEILKKQVLHFYDYAIVAGSRHYAYLKKLGMHDEKIRQVGNVVDNRFFCTSNQHRSGFLFVGRFLPIKNLDRLVLAYQQYRLLCKNYGFQPESLTLVGDGETKQDLLNLIHSNSIEGIFMPGILQIDEVRKAYAAHKVFILPSTSEPWGLVVNEAMAAGLPILVSDTCGCVPELLNHGKNGYSFDPYDIENLAEKLFMFTKNENKATEFGKESKKIIADFTPQKYAANCLAFFKTITAE